MNVNKFLLISLQGWTLYAVRTIGEITHIDCCIEIDFQFEIDVQANHMNGSLSAGRNVWPICFLFSTQSAANWMKSLWTIVYLLDSNTAAASFIQMKKNQREMRIIH